MKKHLLYYQLFALVLIVTSCTKSKTVVTEINVPGNNIFIPVKIESDALLGSVCGFGNGFLVINQDTAIPGIHECRSLPANSGITNLPAYVKIQFHDTTGLCQGAHYYIVIDSIKH